MPDNSQPNYAAQITISLPGEGESVTMTVTLLPADVVDVEGILRPLAECTLADLERYAAELEADVWETYDAIVLSELGADERIQFEVKLLDNESQSGGEWQQLNLVLPVESPPAISEAAGDLEEEPVEATAEADVEVGAEETGVEAVAEEADQTEADEADTPDVAVAEAELVYPEIEDGPSGDVQAAEIVSSRARVRVAGKRLPSGNPTWAAVDILIDESSFRSAQAHALSSLNREVAGVLVGGRPEKQPDGRYVVHIFDTIVARHTVMQGASVTYTPESWRYLNDTLAERYPDDTAVMVGWYHTHPGFGIFLSGMDLFIHQNFFTQIWHVAYVLDPIARTSGFFCWDRQKTRVSRYDFPWPYWASESW